MTIINTNARSLAPKIDSLIECVNELDVSVAVVTETWLKDGPELEQDLLDLEGGAGLSALTLNRDPNPLTGVAHGGVAIIWRKSIGSFKRIPLGLANPEKFEVLPTVGSLRGSSRKLVVIGIYMPPNYNVPKANLCLDYIENMMVEIRAKYRDPYIVVCGDFNQWPIERALVEFPDMRETEAGPTRGDRSIDRYFSNMSRSVEEAGTVPPLDAGGGLDAAKSDHRIVYATTKLQRREEFEWLTYSYRHFTDEAQAEFGSWIVMHDWTEVVLAEGSNNKAAAYQRAIDWAMDNFFPMRTTRRKSTDLPWINRAIKKKIARRRRIYKKEGKSMAWRLLKARIDEMLRERKENYMNKKKQQLTEKDANRSFFRLVKAFSTPEKPQSFDVRSLRPGKTSEQVAEELAVFFNRISSEFEPLAPHQIPITKGRKLPEISPHEVSSRIKHFKKPKSMVAGDVFPQLMTKFSDFFAIPLSCIYREISESYVWPIQWKTEFVTVIPKNNSPGSFEDLRNISCTMLVSKIMESYVLEWAMDEVTTKYNQYGGVRGCSGTHLIMKVWHKIMKNLEDRRAATVLTSIDYAKAFNRLSYQHCLASFAAKGASTPVIRLLATFLTNRSMKVRVGQSWSGARPVTGGCPQGSILGVFLFNITTDDLEDDSAYVSSPGAPPAPMDEQDSFYEARADTSGPVFEDEGSGPDLTCDSAEGEEYFSLASSEDMSPFASTPTGGGSFFTDIALDLSPVRDGYLFDIRLNGRGDFGERLGRRIIYSNEGDLTPPPEPTSTCLGPWRSGLVDVDKYVDDNLQEEVISHENAVVVGNVKTKHAIATQNVFRHIIRRAEGKGMRVNSNKTTMLCICDSQNYEVGAYIEDADGVRVESGKKMKVLGWHFSNKPTVEAYVEVLKRRFRQRYWIIRHLKHNAFSQEDLIKVYTSLVRPVADYMQEVYHSMLTDRQDEEIERLQTHALKCVYGPRISGRKMREMSGLSTLRERRILAADRFAEKCAAGGRFEDWFPRIEHRRSSRRAADEFVEEFARCDRLYNSPIFYMRRRLNGKPGRSYGKRNEEYRS